MSKKTPSRTSPQGGNRGCLCADGTYSIDCCDGSLQAQGVGSLVDGSIGNIVQNIITRIISNRVENSGILYNRPIYSGWRTSFANYDEAYQKANGTYDYTKINPEFIARLDYSVTNAFFTLTELNSFSNLARFTDENGYYYTNPFDSGSATNQSAFASDYIIDHLTGLGWRRTKISGNWATLLSSAESQTFATYSDWRIPTIYELFSLVNCDTDALIVGSRKTGLEWFPFDQPSASEYNSATTNAINTSEIYTYFAGVTASISVNLNRNPKTLVAPSFDTF